jgi:hypothetical protein
MQLRKVTIGLQLNAIPVTYTFLAYVQSNRTETNVVFIPIGKQFIYAINSNSYIAHSDLSIVVYRQYQWIDVIEKEKFMKMLEIISKKLSESNILAYPSDGIQMQYIYWEPLLSPDNRVSTMVADVTPSQPVVRALIDVVDQLYDHYPKANIAITFFVADSSTLKLSELKRKFYVFQIMTRMEYTYDGKYLYFFNDDVGRFKYAMITGRIDFDLKPQFDKYLTDLFILNYDNLSANLVVKVIAIQANVNYDSILFNP